jgi:hypothetical protein
MRACDNRQLQTVFATDWVATPDLSLQEWHKSPKLFCHRLPAKFKGNTHPIVIVTCREERYQYLFEYGVALSLLSQVEKDDGFMELTQLRKQKALEAEAAAVQAQQSLLDGFNKGIISEHVANNCIARLRKPLGYRDPISTCWIPGSLMYATMSVNSLRQYEVQTQIALYGSDQRSKDNGRQDRSRSRTKISKLATNNERVFDDQPYGKDCKRLTELVIATALPKLLEINTIPASIDLSDIEIVTPKSRRVTKNPEYFGHEREQRSLGAFSGLALSA